MAQVVIDPKGTKIVVDSSKWKISGSNIYSKNTGNVGIGTSTPVYKLDVTAVSNPLRLLGLQNGNFANDSLVVVQNGVIKKASPLAQFAWLQNGNSFGTLGVLGTTDNNDLSFITNGTERMHLDTRGNTFGGGGNGFGKNITGGFIHGFENRVESSGSPSFALGSTNTIDAADYSIAIGEGNTIKSGSYNFAFGNGNDIPAGIHNYLLGEKNTAGKEYLLSFGIATDFSSLHHGFSLGMNNKIATFLSLDAADSYIGTSGGKLGIGTTTPSAQLHTTADVRFEGIGTNTTNTNIVTTDGSGNVTTRALSSLLSGSAITSLNGLTNSAQTFTTGTSGTDFNIASAGSVHTFNLPTASATNRGALSSANWTTFNNKIGTVTATTAAAVTTAGTTATVNNTGAYWNANQLQGRAVSTTAPASSQVLAWNGTAWAPAAAAPATTTHTLTNAANTITSVVNGVSATAPAVNTVANSSSTNTLTTTVNGVAGTGVNIINSNTLTQNGSNQLISTVNGVATTALTANITGDVTGNLGAAVVSKINGSPLGATTGASSGQVLAWNGTAWAPAAAAPATTTVSNTNTAPNSLTTTVNGVTGSAVPIVNAVSNTLSGTNLTTTVNGVTGAAVNLSGIIPATTNALNLSGNTITSTVNGVTATSNAVSAVSSTSSGNNITTTVNGVTGTTVPIVNSISNTLSGTNLTTTVNGVTGASVNLSGIIPATTHTMNLAGNTLTSVVNGVTATSNAVSAVTSTSSGNNITTSVNGVAGTTVPIVNSISNTSSANNLTTTVNGVTGASVPIVNTISNSLSGTNLTTTVNGVTGAAVNLSGIIPATTNALSLSGNTLTSTVNGIAAASNAVSAVSNTSSANTLSTTVNGVTGSNVTIINTNALNLASGALTSTVNGVNSAAVNVLATASNGLTAATGNVRLGGALTQATAIVTTATNTLALQGLQNGAATDSILVSATGSGGIIKKIAAPQSFPQLLVDVRRTSTYSPTAAYATLIYNTASINVGTAYNTTTGVFTAPATGMYEIIVNNGYNWPATNAQIVNQIVVNGAVDMEKSISSYPTVTNTNTTVTGSTIVTMTAGQTASISVGGEIGAVTPLFGTGQHVLKIIRLQ